MSSWGSLAILLGLLVHCLLGLFLHFETRFASRIPTWRLPVSGHVACLFTADLEVSGASGNEVSRREVHWVGGSGPDRKRIRLNRELPPHLVGMGIQCRPRVWKRLCPVVHSLPSIPDSKKAC